MKHYESKFAPTEKKKIKDSIPLRKLSVDNVTKFYSPKPKKRKSSNDPLHTVTFPRIAPNKPNITTSLSGKKDIPLTTPDRRKNSTQNIYNIIFNNSNINIQSSADQFNSPSPNILVINTKEADSKKAAVNIVVKGIESTTNNIIKENIINNIRIDRRGVPIVKFGRKHMVSFLDRVESDKRLVDIASVESYKQFNLENSYGEKGKKVSCTTSMACCLLV
jgi:hypothetical protein